MDYFDENKLCSVNEFYENAEKQRKELKKNGVTSEDENAMKCPENRMDFGVFLNDIPVKTRNCEGCSKKV